LGDRGKGEQGRGKGEQGRGKTNTLQVEDMKTYSLKPGKQDVHIVVGQ
jgi:hypothetical protein